MWAGVKGQSVDARCQCMAGVKVGVTGVRGQESLCERVKGGLGWVGGQLQEPPLERTRLSPLAPLRREVLDEEQDEGKEGSVVGMRLQGKLAWAGVSRRPQGGFADGPDNKKEKRGLQEWLHSALISKWLALAPQLTPATVTFPRVLFYSSSSAWAFWMWLHCLGAMVLSHLTTQPCVKCSFSRTCVPAHLDTFQVLQIACPK